MLASIERGGVDHLASDHRAELTLAILQNTLQRDFLLRWAVGVTLMSVTLWSAMLAFSVRFIGNASELNLAAAAAVI